MFHIYGTLGEVRIAHNKLPDIRLIIKVYQTSIAEDSYIHGKYALDQRQSWNVIDYRMTSSCTRHIYFLKVRIRSKDILTPVCRIDRYSKRKLIYFIRIYSVVNPYIKRIKCMKICLLQFYLIY